MVAEARSRHLNCREHSTVPRFGHNWLPYGPSPNLRLRSKWSSG